MKKGLLFAIALIVIILVITASYKKKYEPTSAEAANNAFVIEKRYVNITYDADVSDAAIQEIQKGLTLMPFDVVRGFVDNDWKVSVVKEIDWDEDIYPMSAVAETDYDKTTVTIQAEPLPSGIANVYLVRTVHEMSHYADLFYGNISDTDEWLSLYDANKDKYVEYEYSGVEFVSDFQDAVKYATSDRYEFFACSMKDYLLHTEYLRKNFPDLYAYFKRLIT